MPVVHKAGPDHMSGPARSVVCNLSSFCSRQVTLHILMQILTNLFLLAVFYEGLCRMELEIGIYKVRFTQVSSMEVCKSKNRATKCRRAVNGASKPH